MNMLVFTAKLTRNRIVAGIMSIVFFVCGAILMFSHFAQNQTQGGEVTVSSELISEERLKTSNDRIVLLQSLGWEIQNEPIEFREVLIPEEFDATYSEYNELQKAQGFDLTKYSGKHVMKYSYAVLNHPSGENDVIATLLVYKNRLIGGDVASAKKDGFLHGLIKTE